MATCTPSIHVFLGRPLFLLPSGIHSIINFGILSSGKFILKYYVNLYILRVKLNFLSNGHITGVACLCTLLRPILLFVWLFTKFWRQTRNPGYTAIWQELQFNSQYI
jgi:hypothetical protein